MQKNKILSPAIEEILKESRATHDDSLEPFDIYAEKIRLSIQEMENRFAERIERATQLLKQRFGER